MFPLFSGFYFHASFMNSICLSNISVSGGPIKHRKEHKVPFRHKS